MKHLVIAGGGFAGVHLARSLRKQKGLHITLVNDTPYFRYSPSMYRAATGYKMAGARLPIEWMLADIPNITFKVDTLTNIDPHKQTVTLASGEKLEYDYSALALGSVTTFFNIESIAKHALGIKTPQEVIEFRRHLHESVVGKSQEDRNYVIVGGGPTGVELAAALGDYMKQIARKHRIKRHKISIYLVEAAPSLLPNMNKRAGRLAARRLKRLRIKVLVNTKVHQESLRALHTSEGIIPTHTVVWTAGSMMNPFYKEHELTFAFSQRGKVHVNKRLEAHPHAYVLGDNAATKYSGLALTACLHAEYAAKDIARRMAHRHRPDYHQFKPISVVPAGRWHAIFQWGPVTFDGWTAAIIRTFADFIGYADVLGYGRAYWALKASELPEEWCSVCATK